MVEYPLSKVNRLQLARAFRQVSRVDLSIECVLEGQMGKAYVDDLERPAVFKLQTGPFVYLAGEAVGLAAGELLQSISPYTLLMPSAPGWLEAAQARYGEKLLSFDRYCFSSGHLAFEHLSRLRETSRYGDRVRRMERPWVESAWGREHFVDLSEYESAEDFIQRGIGYYAARSERVIGAAFASLACSRGIEVSVFVEEDFRRQGMATALASQLLLWCLNNNMDAHWDAANPESCKLAMKLGYKPAGSYLAYYLRG